MPARDCASARLGVSSATRGSSALSTSRLSSFMSVTPPDERMTGSHTTGASGTRASAPATAWACASLTIMPIFTALMPAAASSSKAARSERITLGSTGFVA